LTSAEAGGAGTVDGPWVTVKLLMNGFGGLFCALAPDAAASVKVLTVPAAANVTMARLSTLMISRSLFPCECLESLFLLTCGLVPLLS